MYLQRYGHPSGPSWGMCLRGAGRAEFDYEQCQLSSALMVRWGALRLHLVERRAIALSMESGNQSR